MLDTIFNDSTWRYVWIFLAVCILFQLGKRFSGASPVQIQKYQQPTKPKESIVTPKMETESLEKELAELKTIFSQS